MYPVQIALFVVSALVAMAPASLHAFVHLRTMASIPMDDGQSLAADVYLPAATGAWPVVLIQTPYDKDEFIDTFTKELSSDPLLKSPDYAWVVVDWRGFFASSGAAYAGAPARGKDGRDCVEWIAAQPWCSGNVGTWGASALGLAQILTAAEQPAALKACVPIVVDANDTYEHAYEGGVYRRNQYAFITTYYGLSYVTANPLYNTLWSLIETTDNPYPDIDVPMLFISGWYDINVRQSIPQFHRLRAEGGPVARAHSKLYIGPWSHSYVGAQRTGQLDFPAADKASSIRALEFFDHHLRGIANQADARAVVAYYRMGADRWLAAPAWPPDTSSNQTWYLRADASLSPTADPSPAATRALIVDPANPVPTRFGRILRETLGVIRQGPGDLAFLEGRPDVASFTTAPLASPLTIEGNPTATIHIQSTAIDTDVVVRLLDVYPDGKAYNLCESVRRASLRNTYTMREWLSPGVVYAIPVSLPPISATIAAGHRLRVMIAPSCSDEFDVNMQDGSALSDTPGAVATPGTITIHTNAVYASRVVLPTTPNGAAGNTWWME